MNLLPHSADHLVNAIGSAATMAAGHADHLARGADRRPPLLPRIAGIAHGEFQKTLTAAITQDADAVSEGGLGPHNAFIVICPRQQLIGGGARVPLGAEAKVYMAVEQARHQGAAGRVGRLALEAGEFTRRRYLGALAVLHQNRLAIHDFAATIEQEAVAVQFRHLVNPCTGYFNNSPAPYGPGRRTARHSVGTRQIPDRRQPVSGNH